MIYMKIGIIGGSDGDAQLVGQSPLIQVDGLAESARGLVNAREIVPGGQSVEMIGAHNAFAVGKVLLEQGNGVVESFRQFVGAGEIVPGGQDEGNIRYDYANVRIPPYQNTCFINSICPDIIS